MLQHAAAAAAMSLQSCPTLRDPIDGSPPGSPVPGILQAGTLEWVAISFSNAWNIGEPQKDDGKWENQTNKAACCMIPFIGNVQNRPFMET